MKKIVFTLSLLTLSACNEYWWTRGQPPSAKELVLRAEDRFNLSINERAQTRADFAPSAQKLKSSLLQTLEASYKNDKSKNDNSLKESVKATEMSFIELEGKMSIGSRAAYGELCNQIRAFASKADAGENVDPSAFELFTSRSIFFLANELKVPAPTF